MTRQLSLSAAEGASVQPDGSLWLAWEGMCSLCIEGGNDHESFTGAGTCVPNLPPLEFALACAPLTETCRGKCEFHGRCMDPIACPDCRIELVGQCYEDPWCCGCETGHVLGHAYAIGQPLPIVTPRGWADSEGIVLVIWPDGHCIVMDDDEVSGEGFRLAHYGPPETLVGRWALQLRVVQ